MRYLEGLDVRCVSSEEAEIIVCTGFFDDETETPDDYRATLSAWSARKVPLICANPDLVVERGHRLIPCAGAIAASTRSLAAKPALPASRICRSIDASLAEARDVRGEFRPVARVAIGDGMPTDVRGALDFGLDLLYISAGIHAREYVVDGHDRRGSARRLSGA